LHRAAPCLALFPYTTLFRSPCGGEGVSFLRGVVHDPTARRMDGVAGHAGLFSTAADLSRFCRMLLGGGRLGNARILSPAAIARIDRKSTRLNSSHGSISYAV